MQILIRKYKELDAKALLEAHRAAVQKTAAKDYTSDILEEWSPIVDEKRIERFKRENSVDVRVVAEVGGKIVGFGELVTTENLLGACYVHPEYGGNGVGKKIISKLEEIAREKGLVYLSMDSSLTAEKFYNAHGYKSLEYAEHFLRSGQKMACVKMRKDFSL
ncbi:MAG: GNAT family N-acetyltransferase [Pseudomonadota bacterium]